MHASAMPKGIREPHVALAGGGRSQYPLRTRQPAHFRDPPFDARTGLATAPSWSDPYFSTPVRRNYFIGMATLPIDCVQALGTGSWVVP